MSIELTDEQCDALIKLAFPRTKPSAAYRVLARLAHAKGRPLARYIAAASPAAILAVLDALEAAQRDAERYRFIRDADRSDCITPELALYAMESLDEYVDAAMEDEARNAAITNTGA